MAGFRRLCDRFRRAGGPIVQGGAEGAKFKRLRRLWGIWPGGRQGREAARAARPCARVTRRRPVRFPVVKSAVKWCGCAGPRERKTGGARGAKIVHVSFLKWGWTVSWIVIWMVIGTYIQTPLRTKTRVKMAILKRFAPPNCTKRPY